MEERTEPRRRNAAETRARILIAAYESFARNGYARTGIREIAAEAGVASSLLLRYFGSKVSLFEEALVHALYAEAVFTTDKARFGETMAAMIAEDREVKQTIMLVQALADMDAKAVARRVSRDHMLEGLAEWLGPPDAHARALNMLSLFTGFAIHAQQLHEGPIPPVSRQWLARTLQDIVDAG